MPMTSETVYQGVLCEMMLVIVLYRCSSRNSPILSRFYSAGLDALYCHTCRYVMFNRERSPAFQSDLVQRAIWRAMWPVQFNVLGVYESLRLAALHHSSSDAVP